MNAYFRGIGDSDPVINRNCRRPIIHRVGGRGYLIRRRQSTVDCHAEVARSLDDIDYRQEHRRLSNVDLLCLELGVQPQHLGLSWVQLGLPRWRSGVSHSL